MPGLRHPGRPVHDQPGDRPDAPGRRHSHVRQPRWTVAQPGQPGRCVVTEHGARADAQHGRPQHGLAVQLAAEHGVHAALHLLPPAAAQPPGDCVAADVGIAGLLPGNHARLNLGEFPQRMRQVSGHAPSIDPGAARRKRKFPLVEKPPGFHSYARRACGA